MNPGSEPTPADVSAVDAFLGNTPAPVQTPAPAPVAQPATPAPQPQMQPETPVSQPAPTQSQTDPFATLFASEPAVTPTEPVAPQAPAPAEPVAPAPTEPVAPVEPAQAPAQTPAPQDEYQTYEDYIQSVLQGVPQAPATPNAEDIDPNDPVAIKGFFDDLVNTAVQRAQAETQRTTALQNAEKTAWEGAFEKYPTLKSNKDIRDMVHNIRIANFQRGIAMTPVQAAEKLLSSLGRSYQQGVVDNQVQTTYESVQPNGGGTGAPVATSLDKDQTLTAVQNGGEAALAAILDAEIKGGRTW